MPHEHAELPWWAVVPFVTLLLCIAALPLHRRLSHYWERNSCKAAVAFLLGVPVAIWMCLAGHMHGVEHAVVEYAQFIVLLFSLFTIGASISVAGDIQATPRNNTLFLLVGGLLASLIGTTGAAMTLAPAILNTNKERMHTVHTIVFGIFIIANCGGCMLPVGDPPLFLGYLRGVPFFWTLEMWQEWLFVNGMLLTIYYGLDCKVYATEKPRDLEADERQIEPIRLVGWPHIFLVCGVTLAVAMIPISPIREFVLLGLVATSWMFRNKESFRRNSFHWHPIAEVAVLFVGIFLTMVPALIVLKQVSGSLPLSPVTLFVFTGGLSAFLDNAPTYVVFFEMARQVGGSSLVAGVASTNLVAISLGAVFFGAMTYIGNGPNFMVKAIAEGRGVKMPSFFGYIFYWSLRYLAPVLLAMALLFILHTPIAHFTGGVIAGSLVAVSAMRAIKYRTACQRVTAGVVIEPEPELEPV